jgi:hypothetical protein
MQQREDEGGAMGGGAPRGLKRRLPESEDHMDGGYGGGEAPPQQLAPKRAHCAVNFQQ